MCAPPQDEHRLLEGLAAALMFQFAAILRKSVVDQRPSPAGDASDWSRRRLPEFGSPLDGVCSAVLKHGRRVDCADQPALICACVRV